MESNVLNELFDLISGLDENNSYGYSVSGLINLIKNSDKYDVFLEAMADIRRDLFVDDEIHGISHNERVALYACAIGIIEGLDSRSLRILLEAAKYHDIGRKDRTGPTGEHGIRSARIIEEKRVEILPNFSDEEIRIMKALCIGHNTDDSKIYEVIRENNVAEVESCKKMLEILKDADALDRVRLPRYGNLREELLRTSPAKRMVATSKKLYEQYNEAREIVRYKREFVQKQLNSSLFGIDSYDLIEDDENYYVFRTINRDNEDELDDENEKYLRTSRENAEKREEVVKYTEDSEISLSEIYDNIKFINGNKKTNCISFSSNANVSLDYRNDRFVMLKIPKGEMGNLYVSGKFMLEEIDKIICQKVDELLRDEGNNKEVLSLISQVNEARTTSGIKQIVARSYKGVKRTNEKYTGYGNSILTKSAVMSRFLPKQYLNEKQQLEYNKLVAKLTILETRGKIGSILPTQLTNTGLLASVGTAFSSSEMIHYKEVSKADLIEVSKENMEMFAILQQVKNIPGIDKAEIEELKRDFLYAVQNEYELRMYNGRVVFSNGKHRIDLGTREEYSGIFDERKVFENISVEDAYNTLKIYSGSTKVIPYIKGNAAIEFVRKLAVAKLKKDEYWKVLSRVSPGFENLISIASKSTISVDSDIISRLNNSGVQLSESVNIDISNQNLRKLFNQNEIEGLWNKINSLSEEDLKEIISGNFNFIKNDFFKTILEGKEYLGGENEYFAELVVDGLDLSKVYTYLKPGSKKISSVKDALKEKLDSVDTKKLYISLCRIGISEDEIPNYITNLILDDGIGKEITSFENLVKSDNLEEILLKYKENLKEKVSAYRLNVFLGIKDNNYVVPETKIKLRDYQKEALDNVRKIYSKNKKFAGVKLPTGAGKSFVAMSEMMRRKKENMIYFAPQEEILGQVQRHIVKYILGKEILNEKHVQELINIPREERRAYLENKIYNPTVNVNRLLDDLKKEKLTDEERKKIVNRILPRRTNAVDDVMDAVHTVFPHLDMCCYKSLTVSKFEELMNKQNDFIVFDELHRTGASTWKEQIRKLLEKHKETDILGITATPVRDVDGIDMMEDMAKNYGGFSTQELMNKEYYAAEMSLIEAMQRKLVVEPIIIPFNRNLKELPEYSEIQITINELEKSGSDPRLLQKLKFNLSEMDKIIYDDRKSAKGIRDELIGIERVFAENIPANKRNGRFIVFIPQRPTNYSKSSEEYVKEKVEETKKYFSYVSDKIMAQYLLSRRAGGEKENARVIAEFESLENDELKLLYAINKLNEGVHVDGISGEIMLRPIGAGSNILYFQQIGRVIYAIDPDNPPSEDDIPIIFDVYDNYIARDLDREANYTTTVSDLNRLQEIINWIDKHETLPDIDSTEKTEISKAVTLRKIQKKYAKYINGIDNPNLTSSEIYEIKRILELAKSIDLFELELKDRDENFEDTDFRVRTFEVKGVQKRFLELYEESKKAINRSQYKAKAPDQIKIREGVAIFKVLSSYGLAITDESFEEINKNKNQVNLLDYITKNFDNATTREILDELKISVLDAEEINVYKVFDYLRESFMSSKPNVRKYFEYYDITDLRKCGILKKDGQYIPVINSKGFVLKEDRFYTGYRAPNGFVDLNIMTGTKYDEDGYNIEGYDIDGFNRNGYDKNGYDREYFRKGDIYNKYGFDRKGINNETNTFLNKNFFDMYGNYWKENPDFPNDITKRINTNRKLNDYNFDIEGYYCELNEAGNWERIGKKDRYGFALGDEVNEDGFARNGIHTKTGKLWDEYGFGIDKFYWKEDIKNPGERIKTDSNLNEYQFDRDGYHYIKNEKGEWVKKGKIDEFGFKLGEKTNNRGFRRDGIHTETGRPWDRNGFGFDKIYWKIDSENPTERISTGDYLDEYGFNYNLNYCERDKDGNLIEMGRRDKNGFTFGEKGTNTKGFYRNKIHSITNMPFDTHFFDMDRKYWEEDPEEPGNFSKRIRTDKIHDEYGKDADGNPVPGVEQKEVDKYGFKRDENRNAGGFDRNGIHVKTRKPWNLKFFDMRGYYWEEDPNNPENRIRTNRKFNEQNIDNGGYYCIQDSEGVSVRLHKYRDKFWRSIKKQEKTVRTGVFEFEDGAYDNDGNWWSYNKKTQRYVKTQYKVHPVKKWNREGMDELGRLIAHDIFGFKPNEMHINGTYEDERGFNYEYIHRKTHEPYDEAGFDIEGYYWEIDPLDSSRRIKTNQKYNEYGVTVDGDCEQDLQGYDDIGMLNFEVHINDKFKRYNDAIYISREGETEKVFRRTSNGEYYYLDSSLRYSPIDGLDYEGLNKKGFNKDGEFCGDKKTKVYKILEPEDEDFLITYNEDGDCEEYRDEYYEESLNNKRKRMTLERRLSLKGLREENIENIRENHNRYRQNYAPARLEVAQLIRDTWNTSDTEVYDEDGNQLIEPWELDDKWINEKKWQDYLRREEILSKKIKKEVELDMHNFDSEGTYYNIMSISGNEIADPTGNEYDNHFFDKDGFYCIVNNKTGKVYHTSKKIDTRGFDQNGFFHNPETGECNSLYDNSGYDIDGYDRHDFDKCGISKTGSKVNSKGFRADGTCDLNNGLRHTKAGFTIDGVNVYTGTYRDIFGRHQDSATEIPDPNNIVDSERNLNAYGINPQNGKNIYGYRDPTIRFARYYFSEILEFGREPSEIIESLSRAYRIPLDDMKLLADQKIFIALNGYPKLKDEIQMYFERGKEEIGKNYNMHKKVMEEHAKRKNAVKPRIKKKSEDGTRDNGTDFDDNL